MSNKMTNNWKIVYSVVNNGIFKKDREYSVADGGYKCYKVKVRGAIIYAPTDYFTFEKPRKYNESDYDEYEDEEYQYYDTIN